jgi:3',5'-cyclic AMP phosphodiesterase CpdA
MVGDWGSGLPRAQKVATQMRKFVAQSLAEGGDCHVIHLGDVYYSGYEYEYQERFLKHWPVSCGEQNRVGSWSLNGNHDMYTGGYHFYDTLLANDRFAAQGRSSFFRLFNTHWQFIGLDTAYEDNDLRKPQAGWVAATLEGSKRRTILLTHHQFFRAYENAWSVGQALNAKLWPLLNADKIYGAIWGHEHRCIIHAAHKNLTFARLVGHGGVPVYMLHGKDDPYPLPATFEDRRYLQKGLERWAYMGFAVFDLDGPMMKVRYLDENGDLQHEETIGAENV